MSDKRIKDMSQGSPMKLIVLFTIPIFAGNLLQQLYTVIDAIIVGQGVGIKGLAAIGSTDWIYWLFLWTAVGFGQGFSIPVAIFFGEKKKEELRKSIITAILLSLIVGVVMACVGLLIAKPLLLLLNTPKNIFPMSLSYVSVLYGGIFVVMMYNSGACILRALGDSKTPFIALIISSVLNIGLDLLFVLVFHWGVLGAATATVTAQSVSVLYTFLTIRKLSILECDKSEWRLEKTWAHRLWTKGWVMALQMSFIAFGGIVVQFVVNGMGFLYVAGLTAGSKLIGLLESLAMSLGNAITTFVGQNYGAGKKERMKKGIRCALLISLIADVVIGALLLLFGDKILSLFITGNASNSQEVLQIAHNFLLIVIAAMFFLYLIHIYRQAFVGIGMIVMPLLSGVCESVMRISIALGLVLHVSKNFVYTVEPLTWVVTGFFLLFCWQHHFKKMKI